MKRYTIPLLGAALFAGWTMTGSVHGASSRLFTTPPPPPPPPGYTPQPTPQPPCPPSGIGATCPPTATPTSAATATPVPVTVAVTLAHASIAPRKTQKIQITTMPGAAVHIAVTFPNGDTKVDDDTADQSGVLTWSYAQPGSRITRKSRSAAVSVTAALGGQSATATARYGISFARLDIAFQPRQIKRGKAVTIYLHTKKSAPVYLVLQYPKGIRARVAVTNRKASNGWSATRYTVPKTAPRGAVHVTGRTRGSYHATAATSFRVK